MEFKIFYPASPSSASPSFVLTLFDNMCFSDPSSAEPPVAYRINRGREDGDPSPFHLRTRTSVQRHMDKSPLPTDRSRRVNNKRFPKRFNNTEKLFKQGSYYEYPTLSWPYDEQNSRGKAFRMVDGERQEVRVMFTRTITDRNKNIKGVVYHPEWSKTTCVRAEDIYAPKERR
ncbi:hypothetical protein BDV18DRAFT_160084 [Aspergillus unguis]